MFRTSRPWGPPKIILAVFFGQALTPVRAKKVGSGGEVCIKYLCFHRIQQLAADWLTLNSVLEEVNYHSGFYNPSSCLEYPSCCK